MKLICPVCGNELTKKDKSYVCTQNHSFDMARQGYVNLLTVSQKHSLTPGDTREQVLSRRAFLDGGYYAPIAEALTKAAVDFGGEGPILDVGCGEGYYCTRLSQTLALPLTGLDISKEAVRCAAARYKGPLWLCATAAHIPVADHSAGTLTSLFALTLPEEFHRVLKEGGLFLQVLAAEDHLLGLKSVIYDRLLPRPKASHPQLPGFEKIDSRDIRFSFTVEGEAVRQLFAMTPHVYRVSKEGAQRLAQTQSLTDTASCVLNVYRPLRP